MGLTLAVMLDRITTVRAALAGSSGRCVCTALGHGPVSAQPRIYKRVLYICPHSLRLSRQKAPRLGFLVWLEPGLSVNSTSYRLPHGCSQQLLQAPGSTPQSSPKFIIVVQKPNGGPSALLLKSKHRLQICDSERAHHRTGTAASFSF